MSDKTPWSEFSADGRELLIHNQTTPFPWTNYIYTRSGLFYAIIDQRAGGRLLYNCEQNLVADGRNFLLGDESGAIWSLNGGAAPQPTENSCCRMRPGRSIFETSNRGIDTELTIVLDPDGLTEIESLTITNHSTETRRLSLTGCVFIKLEGLDNSQQLDHTAFDAASGAILMRRYHSESADNCYAAFFVTDRKPSSWCGSRDDFYGSDCQFSQAAAFTEPELTPAAACATKPIFALRHHLELAPGEKATIHYALGIGDTFEQVTKNARGFTTPAAAEDILKRSQAFYDELLRGGEIKTPEFRINTAFNIWTRLQLIHQNLSARTGMLHNWRNNLQDSMGYLHINPEYARNRLLGMAALVHSDGFVPRTSLKGKVCTAQLQGYLKQRHNDIGSWYAIAASRYILETGDLAILDHRVFNPQFQREITVGEAVVNGVIWTLSNRGINGLIRFIDGDWSDPLEKAGRRGIGESAWTAMALVCGVKMLTPLLRAAGRTADAERIERGAADVSESLVKNAWDEKGGWFIRGITDDGVRFCTSDDKDARVSMLMQAWAVLADVGGAEKLASAMKAVEENCLTQFGPTLYAPPYLEERPGIGRESAKRPGCGENGSCYTHGAMMLAAAEFKFNHPEIAMDITRKVMSPPPPELYSIRRASPLWWANYFQSPYAAQPGRSSNIISSGAPAWFSINLLEEVLGIQPTLDGLRIAPRLPAEWKGAEVERIWRGVRYRIVIRRGSRNSIRLDGAEINGDLLPVPGTGETTHQVEVETA